MMLRLLIVSVVRKQPEQLQCRVILVIQQGEVQVPFNEGWYRKKRLEEQLKFFGAKKTRFISCYAKKPRIKMELPYKCKETGCTIHPDGTSEIDYTESRVRYLENKLREHAERQRTLTALADMRSSQGSQLAQFIGSQNACNLSSSNIEAQFYEQQIRSQQRAMSEPMSPLLYGMAEYAGSIWE